MVELPADIREALARSRAKDEPSADDQARVASALALRLGMPDADWTNLPPSAAKAAVAHTTWAAKLLAGAGAIGLATTLLVALPALRKTGAGAASTPLMAASESRPTAVVSVESTPSPDEVDGDRHPATNEVTRKTARSSRAGHGTQAAQLATIAAPSAAGSAMHDRALATASSSSAARDTSAPWAAEQPPSAAEAGLAASARTQSSSRSTPAALAARAAALHASQAPSAHDGEPSASDPPPSAADAATHTSLARELALVRGASRALDRAEPQAALQLLNQHAREFADGALAGEREALRLSALCRLGRDGEARALRGQLAAELAHSPLRARIEHDCATHD